MFKGNVTFPKVKSIGVSIGRIINIIFITVLDSLLLIIIVYFPGVFKDCYINFIMNVFDILENMILHIKECRENGSPHSVLQLLLHNVSCVYETEILNTMYQWLPGTSLYHIDNLANFIIYIRDKHGHFGERDVSYVLLWTWYKYFPEWALRIFRSFVFPNPEQSFLTPFRNLNHRNSELGSIGCWSDVKYMCEMLRNVVKDGQSFGLRYDDIGTDKLLHKSKQFRNQILDIMLQQLLIDNMKWEEVMETYFENRRQYFGIGEKYEGENENGGWKRKRDPLMSRPLKHKYVSLASKWCPREKSKFGWLFMLLVRRYTNSTINNINHVKYFSENARKFRQMLTKIRIQSTE